jgi:hypothetical protein
VQVTVALRLDAPLQLLVAQMLLAPVPLAKIAVVRLSLV